MIVLNEIQAGQSEGLAGFSVHGAHSPANRRTWATLLVLFVAVLAILASGCKTTQPVSPFLARFQFERPAMGTLFRIVLYAPDEAAARSAADFAFDRVDRLEEILSDYQADSELSLLREQPPGVPVKVSQDLFNVLQKGQSLAQLTDGAFDVTVGHYTRLWRFSRKRKTLPSTAEIQHARALTGYRHLTLDARERTVTQAVAGMRLDVGGIAKGYAADQALASLKSLGFSRALVAASGDIAIGNPPPGSKGWTIAISNPGASKDTAATTVLLKNAGVSTSGDTEQFVDIEGVHYAHILNPATGLGLTNRIQATLIAPNAFLSDPLATSVCILGPEKGFKMLRKMRGIRAIVITEDAGVRAIRKFGKIETSDKPAVQDISQ